MVPQQRCRTSNFKYARRTMSDIKYVRTTLNAGHQTSNDEHRVRLRWSVCSDTVLRCRNNLRIARSTSGVIVIPYTLVGRSFVSSAPTPRRFNKLMIPNFESSSSPRHDLDGTASHNPNMARRQNALEAHTWGVRSLYE